MEKYKKVAKSFRYGKSLLRSREFSGSVVFSEDHLFLFISKAVDGMIVPGLVGAAFRYVDKKVKDTPRFDIDDYTKEDIKNMEEDGSLPYNKYDLPFLTDYQSLPTKYSHDAAFANLAIDSMVFMIPKSSVDNFKFTLTGIIDVKAGDTFVQIGLGFTKIGSSKKYFRILVG